MAQLESTEKEKNTESREQKTDRPQLSVSQGSSSQSSSQDYRNTMEALKESEYSLPEYTSSYDQQINQIYNKIVSREPFSYDPMSDSLYGHYREQYTQLGRQAMRDTMGQAAALTGGYGSSYAQQAGQQEYDSYLQKLGEVLPELYSAAYQRYKDRGESLEQEYQRLLALEQTEYGRYRDQVEDAMYQQGMAADAAAAEQERKDKNYDRMVELITKTGYTPSPEELEDSGMTQAQADAYKDRYAGSGGGSSRSGPSSTYLAYYYGKKTNSNNGGNKALTKIKANNR